MSMRGTHLVVKWSYRGITKWTPKIGSELLFARLFSVKFLPPSDLDSFQKIQKTISFLKFEEENLRTKIELEKVINNV
jgi:hypothetical protein